MKLTDSIINIALLGTSNRKLEEADYPDFLRDDILQLSDNQHDYEDFFLKVSSFAFCCENSGSSPVIMDSNFLVKNSSSETLSYVSDILSNLLVFLEENNYRYLIKFAFNFLKKNQRILQPHTLPFFIDKAYNFKDKFVYQYKLSLWPLLGYRGKWLIENCGFPTEKWDNSSHSSHLKMFVAMRKAGVRQSSKFLQTNWDSESSAHKSDFLSVFGRVFDEDLPFLESVFQNDVSTKVKNLAFDLLRRNQNSIVVKFYYEKLKSLITFDGKKSIDFDEIQNSEELSKYGISDVLTENDSYPKFLSRLSSAEIIVYKLIHCVPFSFWRNLTGYNSTKTVKFLFECPAFKFGFNFVNTALLFCESDWAFEICKYNGVLRSDFMPFLDTVQLETLSDYCDFADNFYVNEKLCGNYDNFDVWGDKFSLKILKYIIKTKNFDNSNITAQYISTKISNSMNIFLSDYLADKRDNDIVTTFFKKLIVFKSYIFKFKV